MVQSLRNKSEGKKLNIIVGGGALATNISSKSLDDRRDKAPLPTNYRKKITRRF